MSVPFIDLSFQYTQVKQGFLSKVESIFDTKGFILGPHVEELEKKLQSAYGIAHALGLSSGSDALILALMALNIGPGDEVITTPFSFFATAGSIARLGAKPVFVDVDPVTLNIDPSKIQQAITKNTKAIMPVHIYGQMADMDPIMEIAKSARLFVIEDAAQAIGAAYRSKDGRNYFAGAMGDVGCFSFYPTKNLGASGDAGLVTTQNTDLAEKMRCLRNHGDMSRYQHKYIGGNFRMDAIHAALLVERLPYLDSQTEERCKTAEKYTNALKSKITPPACLPQCSHIYHQYTIRTNQREKLKTHLQQHAIGHTVFYPVPLHLQECFQKFGYKAGDFPMAETATLEVLSLPIFPGLTSDQQKKVIDTVLALFE